MYKNILVGLFSFAALSLNAADFSEKAQTLSMDNVQQEMTANWVTFPISFKDYEVGAPEIQLESVEVSFPKNPQQVLTLTPDGKTRMAFQATDEEGMTFTISALKIEDVKRTVKDVINDIIKGLKANPNNNYKVVFKGFSKPNNGHSYGFVAFVDKTNGKLTRFVVCKGMNYFYSLTTDLNDEMHISESSFQEGSPSLGKIIHDHQKTVAFVKSLHFLY